MRFKKIFFFLGSWMLGALVWAAGPLNADSNGVAIKGHDPVAYFTDNRPVKGKPEFTVKAGGVTYLFASAENRDKFAADPAKYQPQYGGYCAFGVAQGYKPDIDPAAFTVVDGKLFLNLSPEVLRRWQLDIPGYIKSADENWKTLADK